MALVNTLRKGILRTLVIFVFSIEIQAQVPFLSSDKLIENLRGKDSLVDVVLENKDSYRFQLHLSEVKNNQITKSVSIGDPKYFYPASLVKLPVALLALEKIQRLGLDLDCSIEVGNYEPCKSETFISLTKKHPLTFRQLFEELLIVSDNHHYNTLFHFLTPKEINDALRNKGYKHTHIYRSFEGCDRSKQLNTAEIIIKNPKGEKIYVQKQNQMDTSIMQIHFAYSENRLIGNKRIENRKLVHGPVDFNYTNEVSLNDAHKIMSEFLFPTKINSFNSWDINEENRDFIKNCLQKFPREMEKSYHKDYKEIPDNEFKYILIGELTDSIIEKRTFSKIAYSYGFTTETAYIPIDKDHGFLLSMTIYTNENGILNDGKYEYTEIARPVFNRISEMILDLRKIEIEKK